MAAKSFPARAAFQRAAAVGCAIASLLLFLAYRSEQRVVVAFANAADRGAPMPDSARVVGLLDYAHGHLRAIEPRTLQSLPIRLYYRFNPLHPGPGDVVRWGADFRGSCGSYSRVLHAMLDARKVPSRFLFLTDSNGVTLHTVVEARVNGRWIVVDPSYGIVHRHEDGRLATASELGADLWLLRSSLGSVQHYDPQYDYRHTTHLNWRKVPIVLPAIRTALAAILGDARVSELNRPDLWIWPRLFASTLLAVLALALALTSSGTRRARTESNAKTRPAPG